MRYLIGEQIRRLREERKVTQEEIAAALGMTRQRFARIEKGIIDISYETIMAAARFLKVEPHTITDVCENNTAVSFRSGDAQASSFDKIDEIIRFFYANKSMYMRMNVESDDDN